MSHHTRLIPLEIYNMAKKKKKKKKKKANRLFNAKPCLYIEYMICKYIL